VSQNLIQLYRQITKNKNHGHWLIMAADVYLEGKFRVCPWKHLFSFLNTFGETVVPGGAANAVYNAPPRWSSLCCRYTRHMKLRGTNQHTKPKITLQA